MSNQEPDGAALPLGEVCLTVHAWPIVHLTLAGAVKNTGISTNIMFCTAPECFREGRRALLYQHSRP